MNPLMKKLHRVNSALGPMWRIVFPYKNMHYLENYFSGVDQIRSNGRIRFQIQCILVLLVLKMLQLIHMILTPLPHLTRLLLLDYFYANHMPSQFNVMTILILALAVYFYYIAYFNGGSKKFIYLAKKVLIRGEDDLFLQDYIKDEPVHLRVQRFGIIILNVLQFFVFVTNLFIISTQVLIVIQLYHNWSTFAESTLFWPVQLVLIEANALLLYFSVHALIHVCNLLGTVSIVTAIICFIRLRQTAQILDRQEHQLHWHNMLHFITQHIASLRLIFRLSVIYGNLLLAFISINCPLNSTILVALWIDQMPLAHRFFAVTILMGQFVTIIGNHLIAAIFPKRIHQPIKRLIHLSVVKSGEYCPNSLRNRLKVANCIEHFHTDNQYGINYGSMGLVTLSAFFKFLLFYMQVLMFSYQLIRGRHFYG